MMIFQINGFERVVCKNLDRVIACQTGMVLPFDQWGSIENHNLAESFPLNFIGNSDTLIGFFSTTAVLN